MTLQAPAGLRLYVRVVSARLSYILSNSIICSETNSPTCFLFFTGWPAEGDGGMTTGPAQLMVVNRNDNLILNIDYSVNLSSDLTDKIDLNEIQYVQNYDSDTMFNDNF